MGKSLDQKPHNKGYTNGQKTHKKSLNIISHQGNET